MELKIKNTMKLKHKLAIKKLMTKSIIKINEIKYLGTKLKYKINQEKY